MTGRHMNIFLTTSHNLGNLQVSKFFNTFCMNKSFNLYVC